MGLLPTTKFNSNPQNQEGVCKLGTTARRARTVHLAVTNTCYAGTTIALDEAHSARETDTFKGSPRASGGTLGRDEEDDR